MSIRRGPIPADSFTIISNAWLRDPRLGLKEKGLLAYISSHAAGYQLSTEQIIAESTDGRDAVRAGMVQLERFGYLRRIPLRDAEGRAAGYDFELSDPEDGSTGAGKPVAGVDQEECGVSAGQAQSGFSGAGEPATKKTTLEKTKKTTSASQRGTRLSEGWMPSADLLNWAREKAPGVGWAEHEKFVDWARAASGSVAVKKDWDAAWRNWMRRASEQRGARPVSGAPAGQYRSARLQNADEDTRQTEISLIIDELLDQNPGMPVQVARARAEEIHSEAGKVSTPNMVQSYSGGVVGALTDHPEVTP